MPGRNEVTQHLVEKQNKIDKETNIEENTVLYKY